MTGLEQVKQAIYNSTPEMRMLGPRPTPVPFHQAPAWRQEEVETQAIAVMKIMEEENDEGN